MAALIAWPIYGLRHGKPRSNLRPYLSQAQRYFL
ncbi:hypothetical protein YPC_4310 [Yersinia pestis biovar Medievalis str. Harbin 35]|nr:hypothetical protein YPC_4310 [Yersinia pestis biovar Medievalis str. Harbin 35]EEO85668.1 hypothetical protein YPH_1536 [Yersinia pestis biovar Orientalis str. PEXU2]EEO91799.1 hypothetical protein YPS_0744 [Yersinia pestis Pestoides A]